MVALLGNAHYPEEVARLSTAEFTLASKILQVYVPLELVCKTRVALLLLFLAAHYAYKQRKGEVKNAGNTAGSNDHNRRCSLVR